MSKVYQAILLEESDRNLHKFVWWNDPKEPLTDYRVTRVTFGVAASCFAANMAVKHNAIQNEQQFPLAAQAFKGAFYVDDGLTGADNTDEAIHLREELQQLFNKGHFTLRKWNSSDPTVLTSIPAELRDTQDVLCISEFEHNSATTLGVKWDAKSDVFHIHNPADCASRGLLPSQLMVHELWWDGPPWVSLNHREWP